MNSVRIRTPRQVNAAARWTSARPKGWKYWVTGAVVYLASWTTMDRWGTTAGLAVFLVGMWLWNRFAPAPRDHDQHQDHATTQGRHHGAAPPDPMRR